MKQEKRIVKCSGVRPLLWGMLGVLATLLLAVGLVFGYGNMTASAQSSIAKKVIYEKSRDNCPSESSLSLRSNLNTVTGYDSFKYFIYALQPNAVDNYYDSDDVFLDSFALNKDMDQAVYTSLSMYVQSSTASYALNIIFESVGELSGISDTYYSYTKEVDTYDYFLLGFCLTDEAFGYVSGVLRAQEPTDFITSETTFIPLLYSSDARYTQLRQYILEDNVQFCNAVGGVTLHERLYLYKHVTPIPLPEDPVKEGHTFTGWYFGTTAEHEENSGNCLPYDNTPLFDTLNLHAHFQLNVYTVDFMIDDDAAFADDPFLLEDHSMKVTHGDSVSVSAAVKEHYDFLGWFYANGEQYIDQSIIQDTTLYAAFKLHEFAVIFDSAGGSEVSSMRVPYGFTFDLPITVREDFYFLGWYTSAQEAYNSAPVVSDLMLTAKWRPEHCKVTFYLDKAIYKTIVVPYGMTLAKTMTKAKVASYRPLDSNGKRVSRQSVITEDTDVLLHDLSGWEKYGDFVGRSPWYTWLWVGLGGALAVAFSICVVLLVKWRK